MNARAGALEGIRVLDFSRVLAGPLASMQLGDLGADVIKIEPPEGDETRQWTPPVTPSGASTYFAGVNRNKRGLTLDLTVPADLDHALALAASADVVIENFRPGVMERLGLGWERLTAHNPRLVLCSITGFGAHAGAALPGFDLLVQAVGGLMSVTGPVDAEPSKVGVAIVDVLAGQNAVAGILAALRARDRDGIGQRVEISLLLSSLSGLANLSASAAITHRAPKRLGNEHPSIAPYRPYVAGDGGTIVIAVGNDRQFRALCDVLGRPDLADDPRFATNPARVAARVELDELISGLLATASAGEWSARFVSAGVPAGRVNDIVQAIGLASDLGLEPVVEIADGAHAHRSIATPIQLSATPVAYRLPPPDPSTTRITWNPRSTP